MFKPREPKGAVELNQILTLAPRQNKVDGRDGDALPDAQVELPLERWQQVNHIMITRALGAICTHFREAPGPTGCSLSPSPICLSCVRSLGVGAMLLVFASAAGIAPTEDVRSVLRNIVLFTST